MLSVTWYYGVAICKKKDEMERKKKERKNKPHENENLKKNVI